MKKWQQMWSTSIKGGRGDDEREVLEMPNNYSRRCCNNFVEKFIAAKYLAREKKKSLLELRSKMRAEKKKKAKEMKRTELEEPMRSREVEKENLSKKPSNRRECRQGKKRLKEIKRGETQSVMDEEMRREREETRRLRIEELKTAQVACLKILPLSNIAVMLLFQPVPVAHLVGSIHERMQARAPQNPVRKVVSLRHRKEVTYLSPGL